MAGQAIATRGRLVLGLLPGGDLQIAAGKDHLILTPEAARWLAVAGLPAALSAIERGDFPERKIEGQIEGQMALG